MFFKQISHHFVSELKRKNYISFNYTLFNIQEYLKRIALELFQKYIIKHSYDTNDVTLQQTSSYINDSMPEKHLWKTSIQWFTREVQGIEMMHLYN